MCSQKKIVHITTIDEGGAYKAVERIHEALQTQGMISAILLRNKLCLKNAGSSFLDNSFKRLISKSKNFLNLLLSRQEISCERFGSDVTGHPLVKDADIVAIHWCNSFLSYSSLKKILKSGKKIVFFMHDTWLFTGGCHVNLECDLYRNGCGNCPYIRRKRKKDLSYRNFRAKQKLLSDYPAYVVGPSEWIMNCAAKSAITENKRLYCIPNCIDGDVFKPYGDKTELRELYGIPTDKKVILFGAAFNGTQNKNKGFRYLLDALHYLPKEEYYLLIFGNCEKEDVVWEQEYRLLGYIQSENKMAELYNLADVYVTPSLQESFGFTVCESMACGTPVVAFPVGGIKEQITHKEDGYLAKYKEPEDLAHGIRFCTEAVNAEHLAERAHAVAENYYICNMAKRYKNFFEKL